LEKTKELRVTVRQFLTKPNERYRDKPPVPMRTMFGYSTNESDRGIYMVLRGKPEPSNVCLHCGKVLNHPVSVLYGIGPTCGKHFHINPLESEEALKEAMESIKAKLNDIVWEGWLPKDHITWEETGKLVELPKEEEEPKKVEDTSGRIYPKLTVEQEALIERARLKWLDDMSKPKPTDIWVDKIGVVKLVFESQKDLENHQTYKIGLDGGNPLRCSMPYQPKYKKLYEVNYFEEQEPKELKPVEVDKSLVNELVEELSSLFS